MEAASEGAIYTLREYRERLASEPQRELHVAPMISERAFATHFSTFWRAALPNLEAVLRTLNLAAEREFLPLKSQTLPSRRDIISETGFRLFGRALAGGARMPRLVDAAFHEAAAFLGGPFDKLSHTEVEEVLELASRLDAYVHRFGSEGATFLPWFQGHGMIPPCQGDVSAGSCIIEVKYVDRSFRSTDLRQLLCYCGLRYFSTEENFETMSLINPLRGVSITVGIRELINGASGKSAEEFFQEFSYALSSGEISR